MTLYELWILSSSSNPKMLASISDGPAWLDAWRGKEWPMPANSQIHWLSILKMSTSNSKCLLCQKPLDISSESRFILLMQTFLSNFCWLSTSFLTPHENITMINRTQKMLAQNKSNKPQQENKSNKSKSENKPNQVNMRHTRPNQQLKGSVFDKIKIFENKNSKPEII